jgi:hypothetical protein
MAKPSGGALAVAPSEPRSRTALALESLALRHQILVLKRSGTRRPCFRVIDRLFWILLSRWWPQWRESLMIVQAQTVLRWRRDGWRALCRYRARGRWRGGRPRISAEIRQLILRIARENFIWGAPRIHGELLKLGLTVSQATVSRYMPAPWTRPSMSWRTFLRNQASAFASYSEEKSEGSPRLRRRSSWTAVTRAAALQLAHAHLEFRRDAGQRPIILNARLSLSRSVHCDRGPTNRAHPRAAPLRRTSGARLGASATMRSPPPQARASS